MTQSIFNSIFKPIVWGAVKGRRPEGNLPSIEPEVPPNLYTSGGTLTDWVSARNNSVLEVFEDGVLATMNSTSACGPSLKLSGLIPGTSYNIKFRVERDSGTGSVALRFDQSSSVYSGSFSELTFPYAQDRDVILEAAASTMYLGALRLSHPVGGTVKIYNIEVIEVV